MTTEPIDPSGQRDQLQLAADHLLDTLAGEGVSHVFICPGSTEAAVLHAAAKRSDIELMLTTHESITVSMADGFARATGRPAVAYLHANVGLTNGLSHLYAAQLAYSPVVVLTGMKQSQIQSRGGFTTTPYMRDFVRQYTKWAWQSLRAADVAFDVERAMQQSVTTPAGPTWVGLAQDLVETPADRHVTTRSRAVAGVGRASHDAVHRTVDLLAGATRPVVVAGGDVARAAGGPQALTALAEALGVPILVEDRRGFERTSVSMTHPQYCGLYDPTRPSVTEADLILFLGARCFTEFEAPTRPEIPPQAAVVHVHADAAEVGKIYGADVAVVADAGEFARDLLDALGDAPQRDDRAHLERARAENDQTRARFLSADRPDEGGTSVGQVMAALAEVFDGDTIVVGDATTSGKALVHAVEGTEAEFHTTSSGSLGWGVGAALGLALASPGRRVVAVCGDGAFQFGLPGLWTAARYGIDVTYVVVNNTSYAAVGAAIRRYAGDVTERERDLVVDLAGPSIRHIAEGFGVASWRVERPDDLAAAVRAAQELPGPAVVEIMTDPRDLGP